MLSARGRMLHKLADLRPWAVPDEATLPENNSCGCFYLANRLFYKAHCLSIIVAVRDVNEAKADRKSTPLYEIENDIHRIITDILTCLVGSSPLRAESQSETRLEAWRSTARIGLALSSGLFRLRFTAWASIRNRSPCEHCPRPRMRPGLCCLIALINCAL